MTLSQCTGIFGDYIGGIRCKDPPVELVALPLGRPGAEAVAPAGHLRLLVEMTVEQDGVALGLGRGGGDLHEDDGRAALEPHHLDLEAVDFAAPAPGLDLGHGLVDMAVLGPLGVEQG